MLVSPVLLARSNLLVHFGDRLVERLHVVIDLANQETISVAITCKVPFELGSEALDLGLDLVAVSLDIVLEAVDFSLLHLQELDLVLVAPTPDRAQVLLKKAEG